MYSATGLRQRVAFKEPPFLTHTKKISHRRRASLSAQQSASSIMIAVDRSLVLRWFNTSSSSSHDHRRVLMFEYENILYHTHTHTYLCLPFFDYNIIRLLLACCCGCGCLPGIVGERPPTRLRRRMCAKSNWWWWTESETRSDKSEWSSRTLELGNCVYVHG